MKDREKFELKLYELLGVKVFKKMAFCLLYLFFIPFTLKMTKEERKKMILSTESNYCVDKNNWFEGLNKFKKSMVSNTIVHVYGLLYCISQMIIFGSATFLLSTILLVNAYCIMLQRYNWIRINNIIKLIKPREEKRKNIVREEIKSHDFNLNNYEFVIQDKKKKECNLDFEQMIQSATLQQLKQIRDYLNNQQASYFEQAELRMFLEKNKSLILKCK